MLAQQDFSKKLTKSLLRVCKKYSIAIQIEALASVFGDIASSDKTIYPQDYYGIGALVSLITASGDAERAHTALLERIARFAFEYQNLTPRPLKFPRIRKRRQ